MEVAITLMAALACADIALLRWIKDLGHYSVQDQDSEVLLNLLLFFYNL